MGLFSKPDAPEPPDPQETSAAQTGTNISTATANNTMQMVDQFTPYGNLTYQKTGTESIFDPFTEKTYEIPRYSSTQTLNPTQQATLDETQSAEFNLGALANERSDFLRDYLPTTEAATDSIDNKLYDLGRKRLDPRFAEARDALTSKLANKGIAPGSEAYNREMELLGRNENDAYTQLLLSGRGQAVNEVNLPINQITALLSGSQVTNPNVSLAQPQGAATTDVAGLINQNYNQRYQNYQSEVGQRNSLLGGLFGLGSAGITGGVFG